MIEIWHEMIRYDVHFNEILCCDGFYNEIYFLLRQKVNYEIFEERFLKVENSYFDLIYGSIMIICYDLLKISSQKYKLSGKNCVIYRLNLIELPCVQVALLKFLEELTYYTPLN